MVNKREYMKIKTTVGQQGNVAVMVLVVIIIIAALGGIGWVVKDHRKSQTATATGASTNTGTTAKTPTTSSTSQAATADVNATDNTSLQNDLNSLTATNMQENQSLTAGSAAVNDQQIAVPTN